MTKTEFIQLRVSTKYKRQLLDFMAARGYQHITDFVVHALEHYMSVAEEMKEIKGMLEKALKQNQGEEEGPEET